MCFQLNTQQWQHMTLSSCCLTNHWRCLSDPPSPAWPMRLKHYEREALHGLMKTQKQCCASEGSSRVACWISHKKKLVKKTEELCGVTGGAPLNAFIRHFLSRLVWLLWSVTFPLLRGKQRQGFPYYYIGCLSLCEVTTANVSECYSTWYIRWLRIGEQSNGCTLQQECGVTSTCLLMCLLRGFMLQSVSSWKPWECCTVDKYVCRHWT